MKATVFVRLKEEVLDPQGDAVKRALDALSGTSADELVTARYERLRGIGVYLENNC